MVSVKPNISTETVQPAAVSYNLGPSKKMKKKSYKDTALATMRGMHILSAFNFWWNEVVGVSEAIRVTNRKLRCAQRPTAFENSRLTWVSVQDVVLNTLKDRPRNQVKHSQCSATFTKHTSTETYLAHVAMVLVGVSRLDTK